VGAALRAAPPQETTGQRAPLIGRDRELQVLRDAVARAHAGSGSLVELVGDVGTGKSRLLAEVREFAPDMQFVHSTCELYTQGIPYVAWRDPLRQLLGLGWDDAPASVLARLRAELTGSRAGLLPWLPLLSIAAGGEPISSPEVEALSQEARTRVLHEAVLAFLAPALAVPTLVHIEHAHLMDAASGALLSALCDVLRSTPWLVLVTRRESAEGFVAPDDGAAARIELGPLSREDLVRLAETTPAAHVVPPHMLELAVDRSGGSPEFLLDLLAAAQSGAAGLPASVDAAAMARIDQLDPGDRTLVRRASVLGVSFHPGRVRDVLPAGAAAPSRATWSRLSSVFALDPDGHVRFKRPALQEVAYEGLPFRERRALHAAVGAALEHDAGGDVDAEPAVLSLHYFFAGDWERAWRHALVGAEHAAQRYAHADASLLYRRALDAGRQGGASHAELGACWEALGDALQRTGELAAAADAFNAARALSPGEALAQARLLHKRMIVAHMKGELSTSVRRGSAAIGALAHTGGRDAQALRAQLLVELAFVRWRQGRITLSERLCREAIEQARDGGAKRALAQASYVLDFVLLELGRVEEAVHSAQALAIYEQLEDRQEQGNVLNTMAGIAAQRWEWDEAISLYRRAEKAWGQAGDQAGVATAASNLGEILSDRGLGEEAAARLEYALRLCNSLGERTVAANTRALLGREAARSGRLDEAREHLTLAAAELRSLGEAHYLQFAEAALAEVEAFGGDAARAFELVAALLAADRRYAAWLHRVRGAALARLGKRQDAVDTLETSLSLARAQGALYDLAATLDVLHLLGVDRGSEERDRLQARLGIVRFHTLDLGPVGVATASGA
ncbi:MAG: AAA family ATPase, partial [Acidobacteriota bacterium]|nr:AAA family ATPase [Acidobacteriota bacterium]